jgi:hypothetical protein
MGDHIDDVDDTDFTADGDFRDGVLYHAGHGPATRAAVILSVPARDPMAPSHAPCGLRIGSPPGNDARPDDAIHPARRGPGTQLVTVDFRVPGAIERTCGPDMLAERPDHARFHE